MVQQKGLDLTKVFGVNVEEDVRRGYMHRRGLPYVLSACSIWRGRGDLSSKLLIVDFRKSKNFLLCFLFASGEPLYFYWFFCQNCWAKKQIVRDKQVAHLREQKGTKGEAEYQLSMKDSLHTDTWVSYSHSADLKTSQESSSDPFLAAC